MSGQDGSEKHGDGFLLWKDKGSYVLWSYRIDAYTSPFWGSRRQALEMLDGQISAAKARRSK